jgi:hypothetical protein
MMQPGDYEAINLRTGTRTALRVLPDKVLKFSQGQWKLTSSHEYEIVLTVRQYVNNQKVYEVSDIPRVKCDTMDLPPDWK